MKCLCETFQRMVRGFSFIMTLFQNTSGVFCVLSLAVSWLLTYLSSWCELFCFGSCARFKLLALECKALMFHLFVKSYMGTCLMDSQLYTITTVTSMVTKELFKEQADEGKQFGWKVERLKTWWFHQFSSSCVVKVSKLSGNLFSLIITQSS